MSKHPYWHRFIQIAVPLLLIFAVTLLITVAILAGIQPTPTHAAFDTRYSVQNVWSDFDSRLYVITEVKTAFFYLVMCENDGGCVQVIR
jgi:hypothetical protein